MVGIGLEDRARTRRAPEAPFREYRGSLPLGASTLGERAGALGAALLPQRAIGWHPAGDANV